MKQNDDQNELSEYERLRQERIRKNEAYLASLGLLKPLKPVNKRPNATPTKKKPTMPPAVERRSKRLKTRQQPPSEKKGEEDLIMLSYRETDDRTLRAVKQSQPEEEVVEIANRNNDDDDDSDRPTRRSRPIAISIHDSMVLTEDEKQVLSHIDQNYLDKFREFLVHHDKISVQNERNVMRQVTKLAHGEGIRYESPKYGWPEGCYFLKGTKVTPLSDLVDLLQQAVDAENRWGQDRGNGWLLRHPLKKLLLFQQFCLQHPDFLMAKCKLKEYIEQDNKEDDKEG